MKEIKRERKRGKFNFCSYGRVPQLHPTGGSAEERVRSNFYVCVGAQLCVSSLFADQTATDVMLGTDEERMMIMMNSPLFSH